MPNTKDIPSKFEFGAHKEMPLLAALGRKAHASSSLHVARQKRNLLLRLI